MNTLTPPLPKKQPRNGEIELLRGIAACMILLLHTHYIPGLHSLCKGGNIAVEFFFLLSGYLMAASVQKRAAQQPCTAVSLPQETASFVWRKIKAFWPELLVACSIGLCFYAAAHHFHIREVGKAGLETLCSNVLMLKMTGLTTNGINGSTWYLSAMVLSCTLLYPLLRRFGCTPVFGVLGLLMLGGLYAYEGEQYGFVYVYHWMGVTFKGNIRAFAELSIGASLYPLVLYLQTLKADKWFTYVLTAVKWCCCAAVAVYCIYDDYHYTGYVFIAIVALLVLCFSDHCADSKYYNHPLCLFLGKLSLPLYLSHYYYATDMHRLLPAGLPVSAKAGIYIACSCLTALAVLYGGKLLRRIPLPLREDPQS